MLRLKNYLMSVVMQTQYHWHNARWQYMRRCWSNHLDVATSLNTLAYFYEKQGRYADAEPLYQRALAIREKEFGPDHPNVAQSLTTSRLSSTTKNAIRMRSRYKNARLPFLKRHMVPTILPQRFH